MNEIGHNSPPDMSVSLTEITMELSAWMQENPCIQSENARECKTWIDRASLCVKDAEDERRACTLPLNNLLKEINNRYKGPRELLQKVLDELKRRMDAFLEAEEARRQATAEAARRNAEEAQARAELAEQHERASHTDADNGVLGVDIADASAMADRAFADYQKAERQAQIAEKEAHVKIGGGFTRSLSLRSVEVLSVARVDDALMAIQEMGMNDKIEEAICQSARTYKKLHGKYPAGITVEKMRKT